MYVREQNVIKHSANCEHTLLLKNCQVVAEQNFGTLRLSLTYEMAH